jgi:hypothetical protein
LPILGFRLENKMSFNKKKLFQKIKELYPKIEVPSNDFKDAAQEAFFTLLRTDNQSAACQPKIEEFLTNFIKVVRRFWRERNVHSHMERMFKNHAVYFDKPIEIAQFLERPQPAIFDQVVDVPANQTGFRDSTWFCHGCGSLIDLDDICIACGIGLDASMIVQVDHNPPPPKKPRTEVKEVKRARAFELSSVTMYTGFPISK